MGVFINVSYEINRSFQMEFRQNKSHISSFSKIFQPLEAVGMLVSFPTNVHKLRSVKDIPSYGRFCEKGSKTSKYENYQGYSFGLHFARILKNSKNQPLVIRTIQNHKLNNNFAIS